MNIYSCLNQQLQDTQVGRHKLSSEILVKYNKIIKSNDKIIKNFGMKKLRIMSLNVHSYASKHSLDTTKDIIKLVSKLNPDILCLQESNDTDILLDKYSHVEKCLSEGKLYTMIMSKYKILKCKSIEIKDRKCAIKVSVKINDSVMLDVINIHLPLSSPNRINSIMTIFNHLDNPNTVILGDFNSYRKQDYNTFQHNELKIIKKNHEYPFIFEVPYILENYKFPFVDSHTLFAFQKGEFPIYPMNTSIYGGRIDYIYFCKLANFQLLGSYVYFTEVSDHLPVICDVKI